MAPNDETRPVEVDPVTHEPCGCTGEVRYRRALERIAAMEDAADAFAKSGMVDNAHTKALRASCSIARSALVGTA